MAVCFHFCSLTVQIGLQKKKLKDSMEFVVMMCLTNKGIQYQLQDLIIPVKSLRPGILELKPNPQNPPPSTFLFVDSKLFQQGNTKSLQCLHRTKCKTRFVYERSSRFTRPLQL